MKIALRILVAAVGLSGASLYGNGGAYHYGLKSSGTLQPFEAKGVEQVAIMEEQLEIGLGRKAADVSVRYRMKNMGAKRVKVRFGFPLEMPEHSSWQFPEGEKQPDVMERLAKNLEDYRIVADGQLVAAEFREERGTREERKAFDARLEAIGGWMVSELTFAKGQERLIQISYRSHYDQAGRFVSDDVREGAKVFRYRLSTGGVWEGPIRQGTVTVTARDVYADEVEIFKPVGRFKRDGKTWTWSFTDLEPTMADDLEIRAEPASNYLGEYSDRDDGINGYHERAGIWSMEHRLYEIKASSVLAPQGGGKLTYEPEALKSWNRDGEAVAWSEGVKGNGIGEWLEITPKKVMPLYALSITPGYVKNESLFAANNRPSRVEIELNGEHRFEAGLDDSPENQVIRIYDYAKPVEKIRLTIKDVYPGSAYDDTCISYLTLYSRLKEKPEVQGAR